MKFQRRFSHRNVRLAYSHDVIMACFAFPLAVFIRLGSDGLHVLQNETSYQISWLLFVFVAAISIYINDMHRGMWRYASIRDLRKILQASLLIILIFLIASFSLTRLETLPRTLPFILWIILVMLWAGPRILFRIWRDGLDVSRDWRGSLKKLHKIPILLYGEIDDVSPFLRHQLQDSESPYKVLALISQSPEQQGREIIGIPVYGGLGMLEDLMAKDRWPIKPERIVVAHKSRTSSESDLKKLLDIADLYAMPVSRLPSVDDLKEGIDDGYLNLDPIPTEDLLGRAQQALDQELIKSLVHHKTILVTGAGGSIGAELVRQICRYEPTKIILLDHSEYALYMIDMEISDQFPNLDHVNLLADIRDQVRLENVFQTYKIDLVFHAAALKHVPLVEENPLAGLLTNVFGTINVANLASQNGVKLMVHISTDKAVNPTNVMGASKRIAESYLQIQDHKQTDMKYAIVRFGNVLGSTGSVIPLFERQLRRGGPLTVTDQRITRYFMTIREAVGLVLSAGALGMTSQNDEEEHHNKGGIFILDMGKPVHIDSLARRMIRLSGLRPDHDIKITYTGLRPGEKLYEELFYDDEALVNTKVKGLNIAHPAIPEEAVFEENLKILQNAIMQNNVQEALKILNMLAPHAKLTRLNEEKVI